MKKKIKKRADYNFFRKNSFSRKLTESVRRIEARIEKKLRKGAKVEDLNE